MPHLNQHIESLNKAKQNLIEERRATVRKIGESSSEARCHASELVTLQAAIDAVDRAIKDESSVARSDLTSESYGTF
ncbi:hypothetical protein MRS76_25775 [Rhizobiaceae bacterium n13]|uniref:Uncharacterized protein n=1 Tax=Ferirhizobium litorale TaxID=2927786 RepID=A0AAE3U425_9HYPH|nr:hypothetical protein [Fererhizobium litorale]MDI7865306.1 hypothetical protein [Fererhizobium litorale]MDI7925211.1 hypothetical protein [Fererhizobium litorale]